ncbi:MAG: phosphoribosyl-ATP diphosphatase [candidate division Zixibacteria bacterium RBG_16_53_22]|nr:MAG: phosphoribosyl-ATP diphosphatase [candidate division Zixibacteria bacterium RBG_16_53_22]
MIIPSIDLSRGIAVQLRQGRDKVLEDERPVVLASEFSRYGEIALIDLDAAMSTGDNDRLVKEICRKVECRVGGGLRTIERAAEVLSFGAERIIIGTMAFTDKGVNHDFLRSLQRVAGRERVIIALDTRAGKIVTRGWRFATGLMIDEVLDELEPYTSEYLFTCVDREGLMKGADQEAISSLRARTSLRITAAGGVATLDEIEALSGLGVDLQLGMALYAGQITLADAFLASLNWKDALIPTITVENSGHVLMLAWSSRESLKKTFEMGKACYHSRSRNALWTKGETSGNVQTFLRVRTDCDGDAILLTVHQTGPACHTGRPSCFGGKTFSLNELYDVIKDRMERQPAGSYTAAITPELAGTKLMEEAGELVEAATAEEVVWEAADLLYFLLVFLAQKGVSVEDPVRELGRRRRIPGKRAARRQNPKSPKPD